MKALVLAGGLPQIALLEELKNRNIYTILIDWGADAIAKPYADKFYQVSTLDIEAVTNIALKEKVDFLITVCTDQALNTVACVSEKLNLPCYIDYKTARNVTNKSYMKQIFKEHDIPSANYVIMDKLEPVQIKNFMFPLVVKPVDCNSSKGVKKVYNLNELHKAFEDAKSLSRTKTAIIEEFIDGYELSVDVFVENGIAKILSSCYVDKIKDHNKFIIYRTRYPLQENENLKIKIKNAAQKIADAFKIKNSPMLIQMLTNGNDIFVVEFSARTGGGIKYFYIKDVSNFDVIKAVVDLTLGKFPHFEEQKNNDRDFLLVNTYLYCKKGKYEKLVGLEKLKQEDIIYEYFIFKNKGAHFEKVLNSGDRIACFLVKASNHNELKEKLDYAMQNINVVDEYGNDILYREILVERIKNE